MEYFTLSEDLEEIQSSKAKLRGRIFVGLIIIILFFLLRNLGFITVEYNKAYFKGKHENRKEIHEVYDDAKTGTINNNTKTGNIDTDDKQVYWSFGIHFKGGDFSLDEKEYLEKLIREKLSKEKILSRQFEFSAISIQKLEMSGGYWLPLIKSGKSSYRISVENMVFKNTYFADFSGEIDLEVHGLCTTADLKKNVAEKIAKIIFDSIKEDYKK